MRIINRQAAVIRVRQPFVDWVNETELRTGGTTKFTLEEVNRDPHIYLLDSHESTEENLEYLLDFKTEIFEAELCGWYTVPEFWPDELSDEMFNQWLNVELHSIVVDLESGLLKKGDSFP